jgi:hypothetical protein
MEPINFSIQVFIKMKVKEANVILIKIVALNPPFTKKNKKINNDKVST